MDYEVICERGCGFRVPELYFLGKRQFTGHVCARCAGPLRVVGAGTDEKASSVRWDAGTRRVVTV